MTKLPMMQVTVKFYETAVAVAHAHEDHRAEIALMERFCGSNTCVASWKQRTCAYKVKTYQAQLALTKALGALNELVAE